MKICEVVQDLIPLVNDQVASPMSEKFVKEHCEQCEECNALLHEMTSAIDEQKVIHRIKNRLRVVVGGCLLICVLISVCFANFEAVLQNLLIMPLVGGIGYLVFKKEHWILYIYTPVCLTFFYLFTEGFAFVIKGGSLYYSFIYDSLIFIGFLIAYLFRYAFKGGK